MLQQDPLLSARIATPRFRKPTVKDPRLIVGLLLVGVSMWLGVWTVNSAKDLSIAYVAVADIAKGQPVTRSQLRAIEVNLSEAEALYLSSALNDDGDYLAKESIAAGQLVASAAITTESKNSSRVIAIATNTPMAQEIHVGGKVDLWAMPHSSSHSGDPAPQEIATSLVVSQLPENSGNIGNSRSNIAYVIVPLSDVPAVLAVSGGDYDLTLLTEPR